MKFTKIFNLNERKTQADPSSKTLRKQKNEKPNQQVISYKRHKIIHIFVNEMTIF